MVLVVLVLAPVLVPVLVLVALEVGMKADLMARNAADRRSDDGVKIGEGNG